MQDNFDKAFRDKLAGYQAPADPQDWAAMGAMLDAQQDKRRGFFWWWIVALVLLVGTVGITLRLVDFDGGVQELAETAATTSPPTGNNGHAPNGTTVAPIVQNETDTKGAGNSGPPTTQPENGNTAANPNDIATVSKSKGGATDTSNPSQNNNTKPKKNKGQGNKKNNSANTAPTVSSTNANAGKGHTANGTKGNNGNASTVSTDSNAPTSSYDGAVGNLSLKQLRSLPSPTAIALAPSKDTSKLQFKSIKPKAVTHHLGLGTSWTTSRVDRSGDYRSGYSVGLQYTMMVKNRFGIHAGFAFRSYNYFTDLVACNYDLYQCPNSYTSSLKTVDLHVGAQVNLVKTDKVDWYAMGGISNQFMVRESFEYNLPVIDTSSMPTPPMEPPRNTEFTGPGSSGFAESISNSMDATGPTAGPGLGVGKFLRERYLGAWYVGTGVTYRFMPIMSLQVEPVIGRSLQFVGIQDKKLWNTGVNVRLNVLLGK